MTILRTKVVEGDGDSEAGREMAEVLIRKIPEDQQVRSALSVVY